MNLNDGDQAFCVFDVDTDPNKNRLIEEARNYAKNRGIQVITSTPSIELWFLLYFEDYRSDNGRKQYIEKLNKYFDYSKKREDLYDILNSLGSQEEAKRRARKMYAEFVDADVASMSAMVPATRVFELVEELESYLGK